MKQWFLALTMLMLILSAGQVAAQEEDMAEKCSEKGGYINENGVCTLMTSLEINIDYPVDFVATDPFIERTVDDFVMQQHIYILRTFNQDGFYPYASSWSLNMNYELFVHNTDFVSIKFNGDQYTGGAHGLPYIVTYNFDLSGEEAQILTLDDLFVDVDSALETLYPRISQDLSDQLGTGSDLDWIAGGTGTDIANYQDFILDFDSVIFFFEPYQVASYAAGLPMVRIPLSEIQELLAEPFQE